MTDHDYHAGCEVRCAGGAGTTRLATSTGSRRRYSRSRPGPLTIREAADVTRAGAWLSTDGIVEPDRERRDGNGMPAVLESGLGFLPGLELAEGYGGVSDERDEVSVPGEMPRVRSGSAC